MGDLKNGPHPRQRFSTATAMCIQIAVAVAVDGLPTHAATDLFNFSAYTDKINKFLKYNCQLIT